MGRRARSTRAPVDDDRFPGFADVVEVDGGPSGRSGAAVEFRARELGTNRVVRLRRIALSGRASRAVAGVDRRLATLAAVSAHPNAVTFYRSFRSGDGSTVLVLEPADRTLADVVAEHGALPPDEAVAIAIGIAGALETAHRAGVVHGAVSPSSILITRYGEPVLGGLELATVPPAGPARAVHAAPEMLAGGPVSPATDVYGLASTLDQLVAGRAPARLAAVLGRALAREPADRPATAVEFAAALAGVERAEDWPPTPFLVGEVRPGRRRAPRPGRVPRPWPAAISASGGAPSTGAG